MKQLEEKAQQIRLRDLQAVFEAGAGHIGGELSVIDLLTALYFNILVRTKDLILHKFNLVEEFFQVTKDVKSSQ